MKNKTDIPKLMRSLRRDLKHRFVVWPTLICFFAFTTWLNMHKALSAVGLLDKWPVSPGASPELVRLAAVQAMIPIVSSMALSAFSMAMCGYCIMELVRPRTEGKLLLAMLESQETNENAEKPIEPTR